MGRVLEEACSENGYLLREFMPDMKRLYRKHAPKEILWFEEKLPLPPEDKP